MCSLEAIICLRCQKQLQDEPPLYVLAPGVAASVRKPQIDPQFTSRVAGAS